MFFQLLLFDNLNSEYSVFFLTFLIILFLIMIINIYIYIIFYINRIIKKISFSIINREKMDTFEDDITNEKDIISKDEIERTNSFVKKSLDENINFLELLEQNFFLTITLKKSNESLQMRNKSILKIFELFNNKDNLEKILLEHITCIINDKDDFYTINHGAENSIGNEILDNRYVELLKQTKIYEISFTKKGIGNQDIDDMKKNLLIYEEEQKNKLSVKSYSIKKICKLLGKTIFDMSDYINILLFYSNEDEINTIFIQNKILDKYNKIDEKTKFEGIKKYETELVIPKKNKKIVINIYNDIFEKVLNRIDNLENLSDFSEENKINENIENIPKKFIEEKIKIKSVNYENDKIDDDEYELKREEQCNCQKELCSFCTVF